MPATGRVLVAELEVGSPVATSMVMTSDSTCSV
jgi:hypothetical protein